MPPNTPVLVTEVNEREFFLWVELADLLIRGVWLVLAPHNRVVDASAKKGGFSAPLKKCDTVEHIDVGDVNGGLVVQIRMHKISTMVA